MTTEKMSVGPVQVIIFGFDRTDQFRGDVLKELTSLRGRGLIRLLDLFVALKRKSGKIVAVELNDLTEQEVVKVSVGQDATLAPDALPDLSFTGEVTEIADMFRMQSGDVLYQVRLHVNQPDPSFRWGMTVEVTFSP